MSSDDNDFRIRPGRGRDAGAGSAGRGKRLAAEVRRAAARSGATRLRRAGPSRGGTGRHGRGRRALAGLRRGPAMRRVTVMGRIVRQRGAQFRAAPLGRHIAYLERDGVTRDGRDASMFDAAGDEADRGAFAERCAGDRHHFRFIVSPEDAAELGDLRGYTRQLLQQLEVDLDTRLDWVAVDHWNTDNPHIHVLVRGVAADGADLVIDRTYMAEGVRGRASEIATLELGPRSELQVDVALRREVEAERWTSLDAELARRSRENEIVDLRPATGSAPGGDRHLLGRAAKLEALGLASRVGPAQYLIDPAAEDRLRAIGERGDIIKTMHREMTARGIAFDASAIAIGEQSEGTVVGRLVARGLDDELAGSAYAIIDGVDGRTHHIRFPDLEWTGDAKPGAIVELRHWDGRDGARRISLAVRSDLPIEAQVEARGATWLDRQLASPDRSMRAEGFGREVQEAMTARSDFLERAELLPQAMNRQPAKERIEVLRRSEIAAAVEEIAARTGLEHRPSAAGEHVSGIYRERVQLASGRYAMIDDGLGFQLVPWRPALEPHLGKHISGAVTASGGIDWSLGRGRGIGI
ncbi:relaxase/mobilization nuclease domain-containing protein [Sphingopyxis granuli]|uniref:relaxase/mobilization nuclease domain-containing protein n=1 Tax=Sphingopyxis granuli TaxID=267128 RepID=UPI00301DC454